MLKFFFITSLVCFLFAGCKQVSDSENISIDVNQKGKMADIFCSYEYIPLETSSKEDNIIAGINKIIMQDDRIYILDKERASVLIFSHDGKYINKINKRGRGPQEYLEIKDFDVRNSIIYTLSRSNKAIYAYDIKGNFIQSYDLKDWYNNFHIVDDRTMFLYSERSNDQKYNFIVFDYISGEIKKEFDPFKENCSYGFSLSPFNITEDETILTTQQFDNTVYSLTADSYIPQYVFDFNTKDRIPEDQRNLNYDELSKNLQDKNVVKRIDAITQKDSMLYFVYSLYDPEYAMRSIIASVNLNTKEIKSVRIGDEFDPQYPFVTNAALSFANGEMICYRPAIRIVNIAKIHSFDISAYNITESSNPVILKYKLR